MVAPDLGKVQDLVAEETFPRLFLPHHHHEAQLFGSIPLQQAESLIRDESVVRVLCAGHEFD